MPRTEGPQHLAVLRLVRYLQRSTMDNATRMRFRGTVPFGIPTACVNPYKPAEKRNKKGSPISPTSCFERKTELHPLVEVAVYQAYCKRTKSLYHTLALREVHWFTR